MRTAGYSHIFNIIALTEDAKKVEEVIDAIRAGLKVYNDGWEPLKKAIPSIGYVPKEDGRAVISFPEERETIENFIATQFEEKDVEVLFFEEKIGQVVLI